MNELLSWRNLTFSGGSDETWAFEGLRPTELYADSRFDGDFRPPRILDSICLSPVCFEIPSSLILSRLSYEQLKHTIRIKSSMYQLPRGTEFIPPGR